MRSAEEGCPSSSAPATSASSATWRSRSFRPSSPMTTPSGRASPARRTQTGVAVGTPTYMSPEQAVGERAIDGRSDLYSLGVVGYQMLTGRVPFQASNSMALLLKHVSERPTPIAELRPEAPKQLCD